MGAKEKRLFFIFLLILFIIISNSIIYFLIGHNIFNKKEIIPIEEVESYEVFESEYFNKTVTIRGEVKSGEFLTEITYDNIVTEGNEFQNIQRKEDLIIKDNTGEVNCYSNKYSGDTSNIKEGDYVEITGRVIHDGIIIQEITPMLKHLIIIDISTIIATFLIIFNLIFIIFEKRDIYGYRARRFGIYSLHEGLIVSFILFYMSFFILLFVDIIPRSLLFSYSILYLLVFLLLFLTFIFIIKINNRIVEYNENDTKRNLVLMNYGALAINILPIISILMLFELIAIILSFKMQILGCLLILFLVIFIPAVVFAMMDSSSWKFLQRSDTTDFNNYKEFDRNNDSPSYANIMKKYNRYYEASIIYNNRYLTKTNNISNTVGKFKDFLNNNIQLLKNKLLEKNILEKETEPLIAKLMNKIGELDNIESSHKSENNIENNMVEYKDTESIKDKINEEIDSLYMYISDTERDFTLLSDFEYDTNINDALIVKYKYFLKKIKKDIYKTKKDVKEIKKVIENGGIKDGEENQYNQSIKYTLYKNKLDDLIKLKNKFWNLSRSTTPINEYIDIILKNESKISSLTHDIESIRREVRSEYKTFKYSNNKNINHLEKQIIELNRIYNLKGGQVKYSEFKESSLNDIHEKEKKLFELYNTLVENEDLLFDKKIKPEKFHQYLFQNTKKLFRKS